MTTPRAAYLPNPADLAGHAAPADWPAVGASEIAQHAPDASVIVPGARALAARCSLWWREAPPLEGHRVGAIGHFAAESPDAARVLLDEACRRLAAQGCTIAVGPMDGNTWRRYRFVTDRGTEPPFFLEPTNPEEWPRWWEASGFAPLAQYSSGLNADLTQRDERVPPREAALAAAGVTIRNVDLASFADELRRIHAVSVVSFTHNYLYTPLPEELFAAQYEAVRPYVHPAFVFLAEHEGRPVGFSFSLPDLLEQKRDGRVKSVIIKTMAILPDATYRGLGAIFADRTHAAAHGLGFTRAIHALMHDSNRSRALSGRTGVTMRRYSLFSRSLV